MPTTPPVLFWATLLPLLKIWHGGVAYTPTTLPVVFQQPLTYSTLDYTEYITVSSQSRLVLNQSWTSLDWDQFRLVLGLQKLLRTGPYQFGPVFGTIWKYMDWSWSQLRPDQTFKHYLYM